MKKGVGVENACSLFETSPQLMEEEKVVFTFIGKPRQVCAYLNLMCRGQRGGVPCSGGIFGAEQRKFNNDCQKRRTQYPGLACYVSFRGVYSAACLLSRKLIYLKLSFDGAKSK
jgi:hypothetical protein